MAQNSNSNSNDWLNILEILLFIFFIRFFLHKVLQPKRKIVFIILSNSVLPGVTNNLSRVDSNLKYKQKRDKSFNVKPLTTIQLGNFIGEC